MSENETNQTDGAEYGQIEGLTPKVVEGANPGSVYNVVLRSAKGYVGVRRIGEDIYRVRCQRFDGAILIQDLPMQMQLMLTAARLGPSAGGARISGIAVGEASLARHVALLGMALLRLELKPDELVRQDEEPALKVEKHVKGCLHCAKVHLLTPSDNPNGVLTTNVEQAHDVDDLLKN